jgi:guanine nucleotide-binding protein G(i) subunit alpha
MFRREIKVLVLGHPDSGKDTIIKQMKTTPPDGYTVSELIMYRPTIYKNVIDCAKALIRAMKQHEIQPELKANQEYCNFLMDYSIDPDPRTPFGPKVGLAVTSIWNDPCMSKIIELRNEFYIMDSAL